MSKNILSDLENAVSKVEGFISKILGTYLTPAIEFVNALKADIDNPVVAEIAALMPGHFAPAVITVIQDAVEIALSELEGILNIEAQTTPQARLEALIAFIKNQPAMIRNDIYMNLSSSITNAALVAKGSAALPVSVMNAHVSVKYAQLSAK